MGVNVFLGRFCIEFVLLPIALCILPDCRSPPATDLPSMACGSKSWDSVEEYD
jgi:hypothetical protein